MAHVADVIERQLRNLDETKEAKQEGPLQHTDCRFTG
jgi:hypothetical protein